MPSTASYALLMLVALAVPGCGNSGQNSDGTGCASGYEPDTIRSAATIALDLHLARSSYPLAVTDANSDSSPTVTGAPYRTTANLTGDQVLVFRRASSDEAATAIERQEGDIARVFFDRPIAGENATPATPGAVEVTIRSCALGSVLSEPTESNADWRCIGQGQRTPPHVQVAEGDLTQTDAAALLLQATGDGFTLSLAIALGGEQPNPYAGTCEAYYF